jgi:hypothetical protein
MQSKGMHSGSLPCERPASLSDSESDEEREERDEKSRDDGLLACLGSIKINRLVASIPSLQRQTVIFLAHLTETDREPGKTSWSLEPFQVLQGNVWQTNP